MTYKAYIDNIRVQTGKRPEYYLETAKKKGLTKSVNCLHGSRANVVWATAMQMQ